MIMSDVSREEFEALKDRVAELESQADREESVVTSADGLDHRDESVLAHMREHGRVSKVALVKLYISVTDIQNRSKAKRRAQALEQTDAYQNL